MRLLTAQIVGFLGIVALVVCFQPKRMKNVLKLKLLCDVTWGLHYFLLGAYSGFATNVVCCIREIIFMSDRKIFKSQLWLLVFVGFNIISAILTWKTVFNILPATASVLSTFAFWKKKVLLTRCIALMNNILMFTYDVAVASYFGIFAESLTFISVIIALIRHR